METLERSLREHPFLRDLPEEHVRLLVGCAKNTRFAPGDLLFREGEDEATFYLLRTGTVALEVHHPGRAAHCIETLGPGDVLGVSWIFGGTPGTAGGQVPPVTLDARARDNVLAFSLDGACLREKMDNDDRLGHLLTRRLLERVYVRLARMRLTALDLYG
ncbi:MAG: cyclic nucleotide-binding domain-containing protein [Polyangiaceae bacterium]